MKTSRFSEARIAFVLKQAEDGPAVGEGRRKAGTSEATFYNRRKRHAGLMPSEVKRPRQLEEENVKLKKLVADLSLDKQGDAPGRAREKAPKPARRRQPVDEVRAGREASVRKARATPRIDRSPYPHKSRRGGRAGLKRRAREIRAARVRHGYRRVHVLSPREGWGASPKRIYRLDKEAGLRLRNTTPKRRVKAKLRDGRAAPTRIDQAGAMDSVHDRLATGGEIRILTLVGAFPRFSPALDPGFSCRGEGAAVLPGNVRRGIGHPEVIRVDQGGRFISRDLDPWAYQEDVILASSRPGEPTDSAPIEPFGGEFRAECLNTRRFMSLDDARAEMGARRRDHDGARPHSAIGRKAPTALMNRSGASGPP